MQNSYSRSKLVGYIVDSLNGGASGKKLAKEVAAYLIENGKSSELQSVMRDAQELRSQKYGVVELSARSAHAFDDSVQNRIEDIAKRQYPGVKKTIINEVSDESAIGGVNILLPHHSLDITIRSKLNRLRESIS